MYEFEINLWKAGNNAESPTIIRCRGQPARIPTDSTGRHPYAEHASPSSRSPHRCRNACVERTPESRRPLLVAVNQRCLNQITEALTTLERLEQQHPRFSLLFQERGSCYLTLRDAPRAIDAFLRAVNLNPALTRSWIMLERLYRTTGQAKGALAAREQVSMLQRLPAEVVRAGSLFSDGELAVAEDILTGYLNHGGNHAEAFRLLARIKQQCNAIDEAERLFEAALQLAPNYRAARLDYVRILIDRQKYLQACEVVGPYSTRDGQRDLLSLYAPHALALDDIRLPSKSIGG